jgi:ABC-type dipeptide/oligopeptide/nickel transport system permease component
MVGYVGRRLAQTLFVIWGAVTITFLIVRLVPGDPAALLVGPSATKAQLQAVRAQLGLDDPFFVQYVRYLADVVRLDFGESYRLGGSAMGHVVARLPATVILAVAAMIITLAVSFPLGITAARRPQGLIDRLISTASLVGQSLPPFWVGIMLILIFAGFLQVLPASGAGSLQSLVLPAVALSLPFVGWLARLIRSGLLEELGGEYVRTARAKGLSERVVFYVHVLRNALVPVVTAAGLVMGAFIGGAVIIEVVFAWPGIGRLLVDSINFRDYSVVQAAVIVLAVVYVFLNLVVDLLYSYLDPRIRTGGA